MQFKVIKNGFLVRCDIGEEVVSILTEFANQNNIGSGMVTGIGAVRDPTLGYFNLESGEYQRRRFEGIFELLKLSGNFARLDSKIFLHCHATISDADFKVFGGHLFEAEIGVTGEFYIYPGEMVVDRGPDEATGLNLIKL